MSSSSPKQKISSIMSSLEFEEELEEAVSAYERRIQMAQIRHQAEREIAALLHHVRKWADELGLKELGMVQAEPDYFEITFMKPGELFNIQVMARSDGWHSEIADLYSSSEWTRSMGCVTLRSRIADDDGKYSGDYEYPAPYSLSLKEKMEYVCNVLCGHGLQAGEIAYIENRLLGAYGSQLAAELEVSYDSDDSDNSDDEERREAGTVTESGEEDDGYDSSYSPRNNHKKKRVYYSQLKVRFLQSVRRWRLDSIKTTADISDVGGSLLKRLRGARDIIQRMELEVECEKQTAADDQPDRFKACPPQVNRRRYLKTLQGITQRLQEILNLQREYQSRVYAE
jgi:hypothetical protein